MINYLQARSIEVDVETVMDCGTGFITELGLETYHYKLGDLV